MKITHGGVLLFTKSNTPPWVFFTFFKVYKWYQIAQNITKSHNIHFLSWRHSCKRTNRKVRMSSILSILSLQLFQDIFILSKHKKWQKFPSIIFYKLYIVHTHYFHTCNVPIMIAQLLKQLWLLLRQLD